MAPRSHLKPRIFFAVVGVFAMALLSGCYMMRPSSGGGQTSFRPPRQVDVADIALAPGYRIEPVATGLNMPTGVAFDGAGGVYVTESGYCYGEVWSTPRLLRIGRDGRTVVSSGGRNGPWNGVDYANGSFYVAEGGVLEGGRILRISRGGGKSVLVRGLPSLGDHHTNGPVVGPDGWVYFGQGTATNSAVVGEDSAKFGWRKRFPDFHDIPARDVVLTGKNYETSERGRGRVVTGAFLPYGTPSTPGQIIRGRLPATGAIMRVPAGGGAPQLVAWGFRNPFGVAFSPGGQLYATDNGYDDRGSRPIFGTGDVLWRVRRGAWHGWPDFSGDMPLAQDHFSVPGKRRPEFVMAQHPNRPPKPAAIFGVHSSADGFDFSRSHAFGHRGEAFVAIFGDQAPGTGKVINAVGFKVVRVNVENGAVEEFAVNRGRINAPASALKRGGLERPVAVRFDPSGRALYVVDFGVLLMDRNGSHPKQHTGVLWRITRADG